MRHRLRVLGIGCLAVWLGACARHAPPAPQAPAASPAPVAQTQTPAAPAASPVAQEANAAANGNQTGDEESVSDQPLSISPIAKAVAANAGPSPAPIPSKWVDGQNYITLVPAQPTAVAPDKVEVVEVFWYGCPHCFQFDPYLENWRKTAKPPYVEFRRMHVIWNEVTRAHARLFYTMEALGKLEELHSVVFREIHVNQNGLIGSDPAATEQLQKTFLTAHGVSPADFDRAYHSFSVESKLSQAEQMTQRYRATGVPMMVVNGKYTTDVSSAGGEAQLLALINDLAAAEHKR
jgi:protein dithiol oxidoreductase (disulfide-forming)